MKATIVDSIDKEAMAKAEIASARAGEKIANNHEAEALKAAKEADAWKRWGPLGIVGAVIVGVVVGLEAKR